MFSKWLFILCIPILVFTASIALLINSGWLWTAEWQKHDVPRAFADAGLLLADSQFQEIARGFIRYFNSNEEYIDLKVTVNNQAMALFNPQETSHFKDVKNLFRLDYAVLLGTLLYCLTFTLGCIFWQKGKYRPVLARGAVWGGAVTLGIMALLGITALVNFQGFWLLFHIISFTNELWSAEGYMLMLFPGGFWYDMVVYVAVLTAVIALIVGGVGTWYMVKTRRE
ncbi:MAG: DUF1461 domain-containing protein [Dehalococcoidia bacterium]|nr:DUF1461 domain-containing protein [Dehalococcoidia bacterium]